MWVTAGPPVPDLDQIRSTLAEIGDPVALLESLFALAPVGLQIYEASGRSILVNQAFRDLFGSAPPPAYNVLHDEVAARRGILDLIRRAFAGETILTPPIWYDPRELSHVEVEVGNRVAISASFVPLRDRGGAVTHVAVVFKDLTAELVQREQLEQERELLAAIVDQVGEGIVMADEKGTLRLANRVAQALGVRVGTPLERWAQSRLLDVEGSPLRLQRPAPSAAADFGQGLRGSPRLRGWTRSSWRETSASSAATCLNSSPAPRHWSYSECCKHCGDWTRRSP